MPMQQQRQRRSLLLRAEAGLQDMIVTGAVLTAVGAALYNGLKVRCRTGPPMVACALARQPLRVQLQGYTCKLFSIM